MNVFNIEEISPLRPGGRLLKFLKNTAKIPNPTGICVNLKQVEPYGVEALGRARSYHYGASLLLGDALFEARHRRDELRPVFFVVRILFGMQNNFTLDKIIWPAGLLGIEPNVEREIVDLCMREIRWREIEHNHQMRRLALASAHKFMLSETGLYAVDPDKVTSTRFAEVAERFLQEELTFEHYRIREPLQKLVIHSRELIRVAA